MYAFIENSCTPAFVKISLIDAKISIIADFCLHNMFDVNIYNIAGILQKIVYNTNKIKLNKKIKRKTQKYLKEKQYIRLLNEVTFLNL